MIIKKTVKLLFTDFWKGKYSGRVQNNPIFRLLDKYYEVILTENPDFLIYDSNGFEYLKYNCIRIFYTGENVRPNFSQCDYAFSFDYPINERNFRLPLYRFYPEYQQILGRREPNKILFENRKFCCFLTSKPDAKERISFYHLLSNYKEIDSGGAVLNNVGYKVKDKMSWMQNYKFSIAFENSEYPGYTTEKLLHALVSNTIPIYWGNPEVGKDFNTKAFINCHDYKSFDEVVDVIRMIDQNDSLYHEMIKQPILPGGRETGFCREDNIIERFDNIFRENKSFIPRATKIKQRYFDYYFLIMRKTIIRQIYRKK